ncbi:uncharacterized protein LOC123712254 [Pieris brassicae]|uniref:uncharacterized protein LOC123712254 n=1 Tax=Pieris brassicae TaxID=7116 RepID=UPI001E6609C9|nr:uncharacterized protein LOC123712254 [Pieris brassicae]
MEVPRINFTFSAIDVSYNGLNGRIEEFYVNRKTDQVVFAVEFRNVVFQTNNSYNIFYRRAKEPVVTNSYYIIRLNPVVQKVALALISNLPVNLREIVISEGPFLMANFIQYTLCDFGIKVI